MRTWAEGCLRGLVEVVVSQVKSFIVQSAILAFRGKERDRENNGALVLVRTSSLPRQRRASFIAVLDLLGTEEKCGLPMSTTSANIPSISRKLDSVDLSNSEGCPVQLAGFQLALHFNRLALVALPNALY